MSFHVSRFAMGLLTPKEVPLLMRVFERIANEAWVSREPDAQEQMARHVIQTYETGTVDEARLYALCRATA